MKMEHCGRCGHTWGHHAGLARCPKCGWNATQSPTRHHTAGAYAPRGSMLVGSKARRVGTDDENAFGGIGPISGTPHELNFDGD